jgi:hypothetical protein
LTGSLYIVSIGTLVHDRFHFEVTLMRLHGNLIKRLSLAMICLGCVSGARLRADMVTYSTPIAATDAAGHGGLPTSAAFTLPEFNPAFGTLESISIKFALTYQGEVDIVNISGSPQTATAASSSVPIVITAPSPGVPTLSASYSVTNVPLTASPPLNEFPGGVSNTTIPFNPTPAQFALYEGVGNSSYQLTYSPGTYSGSTTAPGGTVFFGGDANSSGDASVVYTYQTPEPASAMLLATGFVAIGGLRLRRGRRSAVRQHDAIA